MRGPRGLISVVFFDVIEIRYGFCSLSLKLIIELAEAGEAKEEIDCGSCFAFDRITVFKISKTSLSALVLLIMSHELC